MLGHIEMQYLATTVFQHDEYKQHSHRYRRHRKEINRHQLADVVVKERFPGLSRRPPEPPEDSGYRALGDPDAEHLQFSVKPGRTPQRIGRHHALDKSAYLAGGRRSAAATSVHPGQMRPELPEALPLPPDDRVGLNVEQRSAPGAPNARQTHPEQPIKRGQHRSFPLSPEGCELQAESSILDSNGLVSAQQETNESNHRQKKCWHVSRLFAFICFEVNLLWPDGVMARDRSTGSMSSPRPQLSEGPLYFGQRRQFNSAAFSCKNIGLPAAPSAIDYKQHVRLALKVGTPDESSAIDEDLAAAFVANRIGDTSPAHPSP